jgi:hypothetical protein
MNTNRVIPQNSMNSFALYIDLLGLRAALALDPDADGSGYTHLKIPMDIRGSDELVRKARKLAFDVIHRAFALPPSNRGVPEARFFLIT